ncbi:hypothetical protein ERC79_10095 [Rhodococcus sp. ABRD24]|uniref:hypothetical protein n=1 Tax=Rhodococcus sp. ABRD24 TaxID=2507582 RepID=UPI0010402424|nr:hypothetical protein [Rhodococcus sp. ABRD24]QBJ96278.1 hypothetical protein ERC79_10095 [Rhodococcus sp. ABRD24]
MPRSRDLLQRFRPVGTPGAAAVTGVPADRVAELSAELEPILALLAETTDEAQRIRDDAERDAAQRRRAAEEWARDRVESARRRVESERAAAAARVTERAGGESAATLAAAEQEADAVRNRGRARVPGFVDRIVASVRADLSGNEPDEAGP